MLRMENTAQSDSSNSNTEILQRDSLLLSLLGVTNNAPPHAFDYLTVPDRVQLLLVSKTVRTRLREVEYTRCKDGHLYQVPFPGYPGLLDTNKDGLFPHQLASLQAMHQAENNPNSTAFGALRGGILGDAPGLGKTITMLALITNSAGQRPRDPPPLIEIAPEQLQEGWNAFSSNPGCRADMNKVLKPFRTLGIYSELSRDLQPPFSLTRFPTLQVFERYVRQFTREHGATDTELGIFRQHMVELQAGLHKSHRKLIKSPAGIRHVWERRLVSTSGTLLVVPDALLEHWFHQIHQHLNLDLFTTTNAEEGRGVVYLDGVGDIADARAPLGEYRNYGRPPPWDLAKYMVVVTTFSRCETEYRTEVGLGNLASGGNDSRNKKRNKPTARRSRDDDDSAPTNFASSFLKMRWLRVVVDEGHELGAHDGGNGLTRFIHQVAAERRWVLSGTPTTGDEDDINFTANALDQLQRLLLFLRHPIYGSQPPSNADDGAMRSIYVGDGTRRDNRHKENLKEQAKEAWVTRVKDPYLQKKPEGRKELLAVLRNVAVLHRKEDINLPKPIFRNIEVDVVIPDHIQANIQAHPDSSGQLLEDYLRSNDFQELVDKAQGGYIVQAIQKTKQELRERGGALEVTSDFSMKPLRAEDSITESKDRRPIKVVVYSSNKFNLQDVTEVFYSKLEQENIAEAYDDPRFDCGSELSRFRHNIKEYRDCPICGFQNDYGGSAKEQRNPPTCQNILLEVVKRDDPSVRFLVESERIVRAIPLNQGGNVTVDRLGVDGQYRLDRKAWREGDILECNITDPHPLLKKRQSYEDWQEYGVHKCLELAHRDLHTGSDWFYGPLPSEDDLPTMEVKLKKWQKCGAFHNHSRWYQGPRLAQVPLQSIHQDTFILSLDAGLSHGLDLSFVTHIFLLEPVDDAALLEQITSRAHRLGASGPVTVETVHPYYKLDPLTDAAVQASERSTKTTTKQNSRDKTVIQNRKKTALTKVVCQYCYRQFNSMGKAVAHENNQCTRNPQNADNVDPWHVSSVYRQIRPPPPRTTAH